MCAVPKSDEPNIVSCLSYASPFLVIVRLKILFNKCDYERGMRSIAGMIVLLVFVLGIVLGGLIGLSMKAGETVISTLHLTLTKTEIETTYITITHTVTMMPPPINSTRQHGCVVFSTIKNMFRISEPVEFVLINNCDDPVILASSAPWRIESPGRNVVFKPISLQVLVEVSPSEEVKWAWDQRDNNGRQVPAGCYYVVIDTLNKGSFRYGFCIK